MSEHTPGPWSLKHTHYEEDGQRVGYSNVLGHDGDEIGVTIYSTGMDNCWGATRRADANLIAAAPDLLAALIKLSNEALGTLPLNGGIVSPRIWQHQLRLIQRAEEARAAIAKATGAA